MKRLIIAAVIFLALGSCSKTIYVPVERTTTVERDVRDTIVSIKLIEYRDSVIVPIDTVSRLSNQYANSVAMVSGGFLHHSLSVVPGAIATGNIKIVEVYQIDSIPYTVEVVKYKDKPLTNWQQFLQWSGVLLWILLLILIIIKIKT